VSNTNRAFGWDLVDVALYANSDAPPSSGASPIRELLTVFTACALRMGLETVEGRATQELWSAPLFISENWQIEVGAVVEVGLGTLTSLRLAYGPGPYWVRLRNTDAWYLGKCYLQDAHLSIPDGAQDQGGLLIGYGSLTTETAT
jgi:hypothetical protein